MKIKVEAVGKFGVKVGDEWYSVKNPDILSKMQRGETYEVEVFTSKTGKKYITKAIQPDPIDLKPSEVPPVQPAADRSEQIKRQGIFQAVLQSPFLGTWATDPDEYLRLVLKFADEGVRFVDGDK